MKLNSVKLLLAAGIGLGIVSCEKQPGHGDHDHDHGSHAEGHDHDHDHDKVVKSVRPAGPNGGRILHAVEPHLEFLVTQDRKIKLTALGDDLKPIPIGSQVIRITGGERTNPISLNMIKEGDALISETSFPEGDDFPIVVQVKGDESSENIFEKFTLDLSPCPTCDYLEYACTCDHGDGQIHDHDHK